MKNNKPLSISWPKAMNYFILLLCVALFNSCEEEIKNTRLSGPVFGTSYSVIYQSDKDFTEQLDSLFTRLNKSMSTYQEDSDISKVNRNESVKVDEHFKNVFETSKYVFTETNGAFDPTIGSVVNAWDFGPEGRIVNLDSLKIDSLMVSVGLDNVKLENNTVTKPENTYLDFNAIAKGYAVDVVSNFLSDQGVKSHLVEIGGEIRTSGINEESGTPWQVGIDRPRFDEGQDVLDVISLTDKAMATSGTYRKFKTDEKGNRYAHIIDTKTGYPSKTNILSVSVIAKDCMTADAYATAFQAMGIMKVSEYLDSHPELQVFFVYEDEFKMLETKALNGFLAE